MTIEPCDAAPHYPRSSRVGTRAGFGYNATDKTILLGTDQDKMAPQCRDDLASGPLRERLATQFVRPQDDTMLLLMQCVADQGRRVHDHPALEAADRPASPEGH